jgi:hypothetical protein
VSAAIENQRISSCWVFANSGSDGETQPGGKQHEGRRQQGLERGYIVAHGERECQHREPGVSHIGRRDIAGRDIADLHVAEIFERLQRNPGQQQGPDKGRAADDVHHLAAPEVAEHDADFRSGDELAHDVTFEAL